MEKVIITLRATDADEEWSARIRGPVVTELLDMDIPGLTVNVRDDCLRRTPRPVSAHPRVAAHRAAANASALADFTGKRGAD